MWFALCAEFNDVSKIKKILHQRNELSVFCEPCEIIKDKNISKSELYALTTSNFLPETSFDVIDSSESFTHRYTWKIKKAHCKINSFFASFRI